MKVTIVVILACLYTCTNSFAQDLTIEQALHLARSAKVDQADIQEKIQSLNLIVARRNRLPIVYADGNINRNLIIPVTPVPSIAFDPNAQPGEITPLKFATNWSAKVGLNLSVDVFNPTTQSSIQESQLEKEKAQIDKTLAGEDKLRRIIDLYAQARLAQQQLDNALIQFDNYSSTFAILKARYESGRLSQIELNTSQQKLYELQALVDEAHYVYKQKLLGLAPYFDISAYSHLSTSIEALVSMENEYTEKSKSQALNVKLSALKYNRARMEGLPKITFNGYLGGQFYDNDLRLFNTQYWYGNSYVNLTFRLPISENLDLRTKRSILLQQLALAQSQYDETRTQEQIDQLQKQSNLALIDKKLSYQKQIVNLAEENVALTKVQVEEGRQLISELNSQIDNLLKRQQDLWQLQFNKIQEFIK